MCQGESQQHSTFSMSHSSSLQSLCCNARNLRGEAAAVQRLPKITQQQTAIMGGPAWGKVPTKGT